MPSTHRTERIVGTAFGALAALLGIAVSGLVLVLVGNGDVGSLEPFTELTRDGVHPVTAAIWTYFDTLGVPPTVQWDNVTVTRGVIEVLIRDGSRESLVLWLLTPLLLVAAAAGTVVVSRRLNRRGFLGQTDPEPVTPIAGTCIAIGYVPVLLAALWLSRVPVAPNATGEVIVGTTITDAASLSGVSAGPATVVAVVAAFGYPFVFGLLGGGLGSRVSRRLPEAESSTPD